MQLHSTNNYTYVELIGADGQFILAPVRRDSSHTFGDDPVIPGIIGMGEELRTEFTPERSLSQSLPRRRQCFLCNATKPVKNTIRCRRNSARSSFMCRLRRHQGARLACRLARSRSPAMAGIFLTAAAPQPPRRADPGLAPRTGLPSAAPREVSNGYHPDPGIPAGVQDCGRARVHAEQRDHLPS